MAVSSTSAKPSFFKALRIRNKAEKKARRAAEAAMTAGKDAGDASASNAL
jgi:hypothetical protein